MSNPNPSPSTRFQKGNPIRGGRQALQRREGDNRHTVLNACHEIASLPQGEEMGEAKLKKKSRLWVMLYRMSIKDPRTFLGYYCGTPRQAVDLDASVSPGETVEGATENLNRLSERLRKAPIKRRPNDPQSGKGKA